MKIQGRIITADEGMMLTDGKGVYSDKVYLGTLDKTENWTEVTEDEYAAWLKTQEEAAAEMKTTETIE